MMIKNRKIGRDDEGEVKKSTPAEDASNLIINVFSSSWNEQTPKQEAVDKFDFGDVYVNGLSIIKPFELYNKYDTPIRVKFKFTHRKPFSKTECHVQEKNENLRLCDASRAHANNALKDSIVILQSNFTQQFTVAQEYGVQATTIPMDYGYLNEGFNEIFNQIGFIDSIQLTPGESKSFVLCLRVNLSSDVVETMNGNEKDSNLLNDDEQRVKYLELSSLPLKSSIHFEVQFLPDATTITMNPSKFPSSAKKQMPIYGICCRSMFRVDVDELRFDDCVPGGSYVKDFTIWNRSEITLLLRVTSSANAFQQSRDILQFTEYNSGENLIGNICHIPAYSHCRIRVMYRPIKIEEDVYLLNIENIHDSRNIKELKVYTIANEELHRDGLIIRGEDGTLFGGINSENFFDFGSCFVGVKVPKILHIRNTTESNLQVELTSNRPSEVSFEIKQHRDILLGAESSLELLNKSVAGQNKSSLNHHASDQMERNKNFEESPALHAMTMNEDALMNDFFQLNLQNHNSPMADTLQDPGALGSDDEDEDGDDHETNNDELYFDPHSTAAINEEEEIFDTDDVDDDFEFDRNPMSTTSYSLPSYRHPSNNISSLASSSTNIEDETTGIINHDVELQQKKSSMDRKTKTELSPHANNVDSKYLVESFNCPAGAERTILVWFCAREDLADEGYDFRAGLGRLSKQLFRLSLKCFQLQGQKRIQDRTLAKSLQARARTCTSVITASPSMLNFEDCNIGEQKSMICKITNLSELATVVRPQVTSKTVSCVPNNAFTLQPKQSRDLRVEIIPRKNNSSYSKEITLINVKNPKNAVPITIRSSNVDPHHVIYHSLFYKLKMSHKSSYLKFDHAVVNCPTTRVFSLTNITKRTLKLKIEKIMEHSSGKFELYRLAPKSELVQASLMDSSSPVHLNLADSNMVSGTTDDATENETNRPTNTTASLFDTILSTTAPLEPVAPTASTQNNHISRMLNIATNLTKRSRRSSTTSSPMHPITKQDMMCWANDRLNVSRRDGKKQQLQQSPHVTQNISNYQHSHHPERQRRRRLSDGDLSSLREQQTSLTSTTKEMNKPHPRLAVNLSRNMPSFLDSVINSNKGRGKVADTFNLAPGTSNSAAASSTISPKPTRRFFQPFVFQNEFHDIVTRLHSLKHDAEEEELVVNQFQEKYGQLQDMITEGRLISLNPLNDENQLVSLEPKVEIPILAIFTPLSNDQLYEGEQVRVEKGRVKISLPGMEHLLKEHFEKDSTIVPVNEQDSLISREVLVKARVCKSIMAVNQKNINFGRVTVSTMSSKVLTIRNLSSIPLLYCVNKTGSIASDFLLITMGKKGIVPPFDSKDIHFEFKPTLAGLFEEKLKIVNLQDRRNSLSVIIKAKVVKPETFKLLQSDIDFNTCYLGKASSLKLRLSIRNTFRKKASFVILADSSSMFPKGVLHSFIFEKDQSSTAGRMTAAEEERLDEELEKLEHKLRIAITKKKEEKIQKLEKKIKAAKHLLQGGSTNPDSNANQDASATSATTSKFAVANRNNMLYFDVGAEQTATIVITASFYLSGEPTSPAFENHGLHCGGDFHIYERKNEDVIKKVHYTAMVRDEELGNLSSNDAKAIKRSTISAFSVPMEKWMDIIFQTNWEESVMQKGGNGMMALTEKSTFSIIFRPLHQVNRNICAEIYYAHPSLEKWILWEIDIPPMRGDLIEVISDTKSSSLIGTTAKHILPLKLMLKPQCDIELKFKLLPLFKNEKGFGNHFHEKGIILDQSPDIVQFLDAGEIRVKLYSSSNQNQSIVSSVDKFLKTMRVIMKKRDSHSLYAEPSHIDVGEQQCGSTIPLKVWLHNDTDRDIHFQLTIPNIQNTIYFQSTFGSVKAHEKYLLKFNYQADSPGRILDEFCIVDKESQLNLETVTILTRVSRPVYVHIPALDANATGKLEVLDLGYHYAASPFTIPSPTMFTRKVHELVLTSKIAQPVVLAARSNLKTQCYVYKDASLTADAVDIVLNGYKSTTLYIYLNPRLPLEVFANGKCREIFGGIRITLQGSANPISASENKQIQVHNLSLREENTSNVFATFTIKFQGIAGASFAEVSPSFLNFGTQFFNHKHEVEKAEQHSSSKKFTITNKSKGLPLSYQILVDRQNLFSDQDEDFQIHFITSSKGNLTCGKSQSIELYASAAKSGLYRCQIHVDDVAAKCRVGTIETQFFLDEGILKCIDKEGLEVASQSEYDVHLGTIPIVREPHRGLIKPELLEGGTTELITYRTFSKGISFGNNEAVLTVSNPSSAEINVRFVSNLSLSITRLTTEIEKGASDAEILEVYKESEGASDVDFKYYGKSILFRPFSQMSWRVQVLHWMETPPLDPEFVEKGQFIKFSFHLALQQMSNAMNFLQPSEAKPLVIIKKWQLKGCFCQPHLEFTKSRIDLGRIGCISAWQPHHFTVEIRNTSEVPAQFQLFSDISPSDLLKVLSIHHASERRPSPEYNTNDMAIPSLLQLAIDDCSNKMHCLFETEGEQKKTWNLEPMETALVSFALTLDSSQDYSTMMKTVDGLFEFNIHLLNLSNPQNSLQLPISTQVIHSLILIELEPDCKFEDYPKTAFLPPTMVPPPPTAHALGCNFVFSIQNIYDEEIEVTLDMILNEEILCENQFELVLLSRSSHTSLSTFQLIPGDKIDIRTVCKINPSARLPERLFVSHQQQLIKQTDDEDAGNGSPESDNQDSSSSSVATSHEQNRNGDYRMSRKQGAELLGQIDIHLAIVAQQQLETPSSPTPSPICSIESLTVRGMLIPGNTFTVSTSSLHYYVVPNNHSRNEEDEDQEVNQNVLDMTLPQQCFLRSESDSFWIHNPSVTETLNFQIQSKSMHCDASLFLSSNSSTSSSSFSPSLVQLYSSDPNATDISASTISKIFELEQDLQITPLPCPATGEILAGESMQIIVQLEIEPLSEIRPTGRGARSESWLRLEDEDEDVLFNHHDEMALVVFDMTGQERPVVKQDPLAHDEEEEEEEESVEIEMDTMSSMTSVQVDVRLMIQSVEEQTRLPLMRDDTQAFAHPHNILVKDPPQLLPHQHRRHLSQHQQHQQHQRRRDASIERKKNMAPALRRQDLAHHEISSTSAILAPSSALAQSTSGGLIASTTNIIRASSPVPSRSFSPDPSSHEYQRQETILAVAPSKLGLRGCTPIQSSSIHGSRYLIDVGQHTVRTDSEIEWEITIENLNNLFDPTSSSDDRMKNKAPIEYRIYVAQEQTIDWLKMSRDQGLLEYPHGHQSIVLYFLRDRIGFFSTFVIVENLSNPMDMKLIRINMEIVADIHALRGLYHTSGVLNSLFKVLVSHAKIMPASLPSTGSSSSLSTMNTSSTSGSATSKTLSTPTAAPSASASLTSKGGKGLPEINYGDILYHQVYHSRSFILVNTSDLLLDFNLSSNGRHGEVIFSLSATSLKEISNVSIERQSQLQIYIYFYPVPVAARHSATPCTVPTATASLNHEVEVYISCRLVKDFRETILLRSKCWYPTLDIALVATKPQLKGQAVEMMKKHHPNIMTIDEEREDDDEQEEDDRQIESGYTTNDAINPKATMFLGAIFTAKVSTKAAASTKPSHRQVQFLEKDFDCPIQDRTQYIMICNRQADKPRSLVIRNHTMFFNIQAFQCWSFSSSLAMATAPVTAERKKNPTSSTSFIEMTIPAQSIGLISISPNFELLSANYRLWENHVEEHFTIYDQELYAEHYHVGLRFTLCELTNFYVAPKFKESYPFSMLEDMISVFLRKFNDFWYQVEQASIPASTNNHIHRICELLERLDHVMIQKQTTHEPVMAEDHQNEREMIQSADLDHLADEFDRVFFDLYYITDELVWYAVRCNAGRLAFTLADMVYSVVLGHDLFQLSLHADFQSKVLQLHAKYYHHHHHPPPLTFYEHLLRPWVEQLGHFLSYFPGTNESVESLRRLYQRMDR